MRGSAAVIKAVEAGRVEFANEEIRRLRALLTSDIVIAKTSDKLRRDVEATIVDAERKTSQAGRISRPRESLGSVDALLEECRALVTGIMLRSNGSDAAGCTAADALVSEISALAGVTWNGITVPGQEDRMTYATGVIGLKFPGPSLWSLPFAVHEFGHLIAQTWQYIPPGGGPATRPLASVLQGAGGFPRQREELWCDFFATFVLGPACTWALLLRLTDDSEMESEFEDPATELATHPRDIVRLRFSIRTLEKMNSTGGRVRRRMAKLYDCFESLCRTALLVRAKLA